MTADKSLLFSIIIPALNEEAYIANCLKSLREQKFERGFEIIVVDNGSRDRTVEIAKEFADEVIFETRRGIARALKTGCERARGDILAFTDADCRVPNSWLAQLWQIFESDEAIVAAGGDYYFYDKGFVPQVLFNKIIAPFISFSYRLLFFKKYPSLPNANMAIRRNAYEKSGGYNPNIQWGQEIELCRRVSKLGKIFFDATLKVSTSFRRYSGEHKNQFLALLRALNESLVTIFRFLPITLWGKGMAPQEPIRKISDKIQNNVALTFDDGPYGIATQKILDILNAKAVKATFFVLGINAEKYPELVRREIHEGHIIGNHSFDHPRTLVLKTSRHVMKNVFRAESSIEKICGQRPKYFRPPYGLRSPWMKKTLITQGFVMIPLGIMTKDYESKTQPKKISDYILSHLKPGAIITLHDGRDTKIDYPRNNIIEALPEIIDGIRARGYEIVPLDQLLGEKAYF